MTAKIVSPTYAYLGDGVVRLTVTIQLLAADNSLISSGSFGAERNIHKTGWSAEIVTELRVLLQEYIDVYKAAMTAVKTVVPTANTPQDAVNIIAGQLEAALVV